MNMSQNESLKNNNSFPEIEEIVKKLSVNKTPSMMILQAIQSTYGYVSPEMLERVTELTGTPASTLYSIVTFYAQFRLEPIGENLIQVCHGTACHLAGAERITDAMTMATGAEAGTTSADRLFTVEKVACLGCCSMGPVMTLNGETYGNVTPDDVEKIIKQKRECCVINGCKDHDHSAGKEATASE